jgi:hypothetical protein
MPSLVHYLPGRLFFTRGHRKPDDRFQVYDDDGVQVITKDKRELVAVTQWQLKHVHNKDLSESEVLRMAKHPDSGGPPEESTVVRVELGTEQIVKNLEVRPSSEGPPHSGVSEARHRGGAGGSTRIAYADLVDLRLFATSIDVIAVVAVIGITLWNPDPIRFAALGGFMTLLGGVPVGTFIGRSTSVGGR